MATIVRAYEGRINLLTTIGLVRDARDADGNRLMHEPRSPEEWRARHRKDG